MIFFYFEPFFKGQTMINIGNDVVTVGVAAQTDFSLETIKS